MQTPKKMLILKQKLLLTSGWSGRVHLYRSVIILSLGRVRIGKLNLLFSTGYRWKSTSLEVIYLAVVVYSYSQLLIIGEGWESTLLYVSYLSVGRVGGYSFY